MQGARRLDGESIRQVIHKDAANVTRNDDRSNKKEYCKAGVKVFNE